MGAGLRLLTLARAARHLTVRPPRVIHDWADDDGGGDGGGGERQHAAGVLGEHGGLAHAVARELQSVLVAHALGADALQRSRRVELAQADAHAEEAAQHNVHVLLRDVSRGERLGRVGRHEAAAVDVCAGREDKRHGLLGGRRIVMAAEGREGGKEVTRSGRERLAPPPPPPPADNAVNGVPSCANEWLLKTLLRESWQFDGYVTSDCDADSE